MQENGRPLTKFLLNWLGASKSRGSLRTVSVCREYLDAVPCFIVRATHDVRPMAESIAGSGLKDHVHMAPLLEPAGVIWASKTAISC